MDVLNYTLDKEAFENNLGVFYYATKKSGEKCVVLQINKSIKDEKFLEEVKAFAQSDKKPVNNVLFIKDCQKDGDEYYAEYEYFEGKPISFIMGQNRKSPSIKRMISDIAIMLDGLVDADLSYGGLSTESVVKCIDGTYKLLGVEFYNTEYKLADNEDLYPSGYTDPNVSDYKYTQKSDVYSLGRFVATMFLAEKFYTREDYPIPAIKQLEPIQKSIDQATKTDERFDTCKAFADSLIDFKGTCPFTDHGSQIATYAYVLIVIILIIVDYLVVNNGWLGGSLGG